MQLTFGSLTLELNIFPVAKQSHEVDDCAYVNLIWVVVQEKFNKNCFSDPLETLLNNSIGSYDLECDIHVTENFSLLDSSQVLEEQQMMAVNEGWKPCFEELLESEKKSLCIQVKRHYSLSLTHCLVVLNMHILAQVS